MRTRSGYLGKYFVYPGWGEGHFDLPLEYMEIRDVNNGRLRPESPCRIVEVKFRPIPTIRNKNPGQGDMGDYVNIAVSLPHYISHIEGIANDDMEQVQGDLYKRVQKQRKAMMQQFSSLNFMAELREVGSLFKRADKTWRHWSEVRGIDYQFGVAPMIADLQNALRNYVDVASRINDLTNKYRNVPIDTGTVRRGNAAGPQSFFLGNAHYQDDFYIVKGRVKGELSVGFPRLALVNPEVFFMLDQLAINPSLANLWEAVPFSWLLDWFLPAGEFLSTLPDLMSPDCHFTGTTSIKIKAHSNGTTLNSGPSYDFLSGLNWGELYCSIYNRSAENYPLAGKVSWNFLSGVNSLAKASLLRDILYPAKEYRPNKGKSKTRKRG